MLAVFEAVPVYVGPAVPKFMSSMHYLVKESSLFNFLSDCGVRKAFPDLSPVSVPVMLRVAPDPVLPCWRIRRLFGASNVLASLKLLL